MIGRIHDAYLIWQLERIKSYKRIRAAKSDKRGLQISCGKEEPTHKGQLQKYIACKTTVSLLPLPCSFVLTLPEYIVTSARFAVLVVDELRKDWNFSFPLLLIYLLRMSDGPNQVSEEWVLATFIFCFEGMLARQWGTQLKTTIYLLAGVHTRLAYARDNDRRRMTLRHPFTGKCYHFRLCQVSKQLATPRIGIASGGSLLLIFETWQPCHHSHTQNVWSLHSTAFLTWTGRDSVSFGR